MGLHYDKNQQYGVPFGTYRQQYAGADPQMLSESSGVPYDFEKRQFSLKLLGTDYAISHPGFDVRCLERKPDLRASVGSSDEPSSIQRANVPYAPLLTEDAAKILIIRYLTFGRNAMFMGTFKPYSEMPWGNVYERNFQGRCIRRLAFTFGTRIGQFCKAMERLEARKLPSSGESYEMDFLEDLRLRLTVWEADDEFPPSAQILFSDNFPYAFSGEDMAYVGDLVILTLKKLGE